MPGLAPLPDRDLLADMFDFLDAVRESGAINMFGAARPLADEYDLEMSEARAVLMAWQKSFDREKSAEDRAEAAIKNHGAA